MSWGLRRNIKNWNDVNHNFNVISWLLTGNVGNEQILEVDSVKVTGLLELVSNSVDEHNDDEHPHNVGPNISLSGAGIVARAGATVTFLLDAATGSAFLRGEIQSSAGNIGGWIIDGTSGLRLGTGASTRGIGTGSIAFYAGSATPASAPFRVSTDGTMWASKVNITGSSLAIGTEFSGGSCRITSTGAFYAGVNSDGHFYVPWNADGVFNSYSGYARWKYDNYSYIRQGASDLVVFLGGTGRFYVYNTGLVSVPGDFTVEGNSRLKGISQIRLGNLGPENYGDGTMYYAGGVVYVRAGGVWRALAYA